MWRASGLLSRFHSRLSKFICLMFIVMQLMQVYISFSPNLWSEQLSGFKKNRKLHNVYRIFDCGCWNLIFLLLAHYNSWKRLPSRVSAWVTQISILFPPQGILIHGVTLGCPCRGLLQRSALLHISICTTYDASGIIYHKRPPRHSFMHSYAVVLTTATTYMLYGLRTWFLTK